MFFFLFQTVSVTVSVLTLTFISIDRWYAICFPLKFKSTTGRAKTAIGVIWLLALTFGKHFLIDSVFHLKTLFVLSTIEGKGGFKRFLFLYNSAKMTSFIK